MDNFFEILIYLFIIFSFLSPLFKKKKQQGQQTESKVPDLKAPDRQINTTPPAADYDILKELENLFKKETPQKIGGSIETQKSGPNLDKNISLEYKPADYDESSWHTPTVSEHTENPNWNDTQIKSRMLKPILDKRIDELSKKFVQSEVVKRDMGNPVQTRIRDVFRNQKTFRDYYIFSEIINKPKAFD
jgi:hypothetical protein